MDLVVLVVGKENVPNLLPLGLGGGATGPFARQELDGRGSVHARLRVVVHNVAHHLLGQPLVVAQLFARMEIAVASVADEGGRVVSLVLFDNVLPVGKMCQSVSVCERTG